MKRSFKLLLAFGLFSILCFVTASRVRAQTFTLSPLTASKNVGSTFVVDLNIDTGNTAVKGVDVKISYDDSVLEVVKVEPGTFFPEVSFNDNYADILYISGSFTSTAQSNSGTGQVGRIILKAKAAGVSKFDFICTSQAVDTNIIDVNNNDIVKCSLLKNGSYTVLGNSTSAATSSAVSTPTPEPPVTGLSLPTVFSFSAGLVLIIFGLVLAV